MNTANKIIEEMLALYNENQAAHLARFFKTGKGQYGEGDKFIGIKVPLTRRIVKNYRKSIKKEDIEKLIDSEWHEIRLAGFLLLLEFNTITKNFQPP